MGFVCLALASCGGRSHQAFPAGVGADSDGDGGSKDRAGTAGRGTVTSANGGRSGLGGNATNGGRSELGGNATNGGNPSSGAGGVSAGAPAGGRTGNAGDPAGGETSNGGRSASGTGGTSGSAGGFSGRDAGGYGGNTGGTGSSVGGDGPKPGFGCYGSAHCDPGERCLDCTMAEITLGRCAPDPERDPNGYASATASCLGIGPNYSDCDGPEDCGAGEYCVVANATTLGRCQAAPAPEPATCCFTCDAGPVCTFCWVDNDCPMGFLCQPASGAPNHVGGCRPAL